MTEVTVDVQGVDEIIRKLHALPEDMERNTARAAMKRAVSVVETAAKAAVPVGKPHSKRAKAGGYLRSSIESQVAVRKGYLTGKIKAKAPHAHLVEYGFVWRPNKRQQGGNITPRKVEASPKGGLLRNSLYRNADRIRSEFVQSVQESLEKLGRE